MLTLTFAAGALIGARFERSRGPAHETAAMHHVMRHLSDQLGLDSAQRTAIAAIFARRQGTIDSTWHSLQPHVRTALDSAMREIEHVLRPDQLPRFRQMVEVSHHAPLR